jgi:hypothetical protein
LEFAFEVAFVLELELDFDKAGGSLDRARLVEAFRAGMRRPTSYPFILHC